MDLFKIRPVRPVVPDAVIKDPRKDLKNALSIEQFKAGREAVFFPDGLNWEYLPYREIKAVDSTDRWLVKYTVDKPAIRLLFRDTFRLMIMDKDRNADTLADLLKDYRREAQETADTDL